MTKATSRNVQFPPTRLYHAAESMMLTVMALRSGIPTWAKQRGFLASDAVIRAWCRDRLLSGVATASQGRLPLTLPSPVKPSPAQPDPGQCSPARLTRILLGWTPGVWCGSKQQSRWARPGRVSWQRQKDRWQDWLDLSDLVGPAARFGIELPVQGAGEAEASIPARWDLELRDARRCGVRCRAVEGAASFEMQFVESEYEAQLQAIARGCAGAMRCRETVRS